MRLLEIFAHREGQRIEETSYTIPDSALVAEAKALDAHDNPRDTAAVEAKQERRAAIIAEAEGICRDAILDYKARQDDDYMKNPGRRESFARAAVVDVTDGVRTVVAVMEYNHVNGTNPVAPELFKKDAPAYVTLA